MNITSKKAGFTMLEIIISLGIAVSLLLILVKLSASMLNEYVEDTKLCIDDANFDNAMLNLDNNINGYLVSTIDANINDDIVTVKYVTDIKNNYYKIKNIYYKNNKLMVSTDNFDSDGYSKGENVILNNVKEFNVYKKGNLIYYEIIMNSGESRIRCI